MHDSRFYVTKKTGTYADALAAFGLARMLSLLSQRHPTISDEGWAYAVSLPGAALNDLEDLDYESLHRDPGYRYVAKSMHDPAAPHLAACIVYEEERERLLNYRTRRQELLKARGNRLTEQDREELSQIAPMPGWFLYQNLNVLQAFGSYNQLHSAIRRSDPETFREPLACKLRALMSGAETLDVETPFGIKVSSVQALNPSVGKGMNRPKPDSTAAAGLPGFFVDWFEEWLRYIGVHLCANAFKVGDHIKVIAMAPARVNEAAADRLRQDFVEMPLPWSSVQIDVLGSLELARKLVVRSGLLGTGDADPYDILGRTPRDVVAGIQTAFFSNLGSAYALTNTAFIGLPGWFPVVDAASAEAWLLILAEHQRVIRSLEEDKTEELAMLVRYRDFLSAGAQDLSALFDFWGMYACHIMRQGGKRPVPLFTIQNARRLLMSTAKQYTEIVHDEGFRAVAAAIRRATVAEQFHKAMAGRQEYEIHYGLFQDLRQKARFKDQVVSLLSGFIASYNYENARKAEQGARSGRAGDERRRPQVTQRQLDQLVGLLDRFGSEVVTMLLVAYGSARDERDAARPDSPVPESTLPEPVVDGADETDAVVDQS